jgi:hypothetical protein
MTEPDEPIGMFLIERGNLQALYDICVHSMDFGSGFLVDEEVQQLRAVAEVLGQDPMDATPSDFTKKYPHAYKAYFNTYINKEATVCKWCSGPSDAPWHQVDMEGAGVDLSERDED